MIEVQELESRALSVPDQARAIVITDEASYSLAGEILLQIKGIRKEIDQTFDPVIDSTHKAHKEAVAAKKKVEVPLLIAEGHLKPLMAFYANEQERKRRQEEERLREEARRKADDDRVAQALKAEQNGNSKKADQIISIPAQPAPVVVQSQTPRLKGVSMREGWKFRITDPSLLPREYLMADEVKIGGVVRALKGSAQIPGVEVYSESVVSAAA